MIFGLSLRPRATERGPGSQRHEFREVPATPWPPCQDVRIRTMCLIIALSVEGRQSGIIPGALWHIAFQLLCPGRRIAVRGRAPVAPGRKAAASADLRAVRHGGPLERLNWLKAKKRRRKTAIQCRIWGSHRRAACPRDIPAAIRRGPRPPRPSAPGRRSWMAENRSAGHGIG